MKTLLGTIATLLLFSTPALAQPGSAPPPPPPGNAPPPVYAPAPPAPAPLPAVHSRSGFTASLSIGLGVTKFSPDQGEGETNTGLAGLNIDLGAFVTPELGIFVTLGGTQFSKEVGGGFGDVTFVNGFYGIVGQYWLNNQLAVGGGAGYAVFDASFTSDVDVEAETGFGVTARASYRIIGGLQGTFVLTPNFYDDATVTSVSFLAAYQWD